MANTLGDLIKKEIKRKGLTQEDVAEQLNLSRQTVNSMLKKAVIDEDFLENVKTILGIDVDFLQEQLRITGDDIRSNKAFKPKEDEGLIFVPIKAQAGYAKEYDNPVFLSQLERLYIPDSPYNGDNHRYFEVDGDSMYPTIEDKMWIVAQRIDQENWNSINNYYIHVIVTQSQILVKRLFKKGEKVFVLISDNEEIYPQTQIDINTIKELWLVKRKLDWNMMPPKPFDIKI